VLLVPALLCLATLVVARISHPRPYEMEKEPADFPEAKGFPKGFWIFVEAGALIVQQWAICMTNGSVRLSSLLSCYNSQRFGCSFGAEQNQKMSFNRDYRPNRDHPSLAVLNRNKRKQYRRRSVQRKTLNMPLEQVTDQVPLAHCLSLILLVNHLISSRFALAS